MVGLLLFSFGKDAAGQAVQVSPLNSLMIAVPLYTCWLLVMTGVWLLVWKMVPVARRLTTASGIVVAFALILLTEVDFGMQLFRGERLSLTHFKTYVTPDVVNADWLVPVLADPGFLVPAVLVWAIGWIALIVLIRRPDTWKAEARWSEVGMCAVGAALCYLPVSFAWYHQRDMAQPPEVVLARGVLYPVRPFKPAEEIAQRVALRKRIDPAGTSRWLSDEYPLMRTAAETASTKPFPSLVARRASPSRPSSFAPRQAPPSPDIIFFVVESLRGRDVGWGLYPRALGHSVTPHLDSLAARSVVFPRYIANGEPSPRGFITINTGDWEHESGFIIANFPNLTIDALPARLREHGYHTMALWGGNPSFDNQLTWARRWYDERIFDLPENKFFYFKTTPDHVLMDKVIDRVKAHDKDAPGQPLFAYVASNGTHTPYELEEGAAVAGDAVRSESRQRRYDLCLENVDAQIGRVIAYLKSRSRWSNTVIVVIGDHADRTDEVLDERWRGMPVDAFVSTAALIYGPPALVGVPRREEITASHVDLMPTVLSWIGDRGAYAGVGKDLFAPIPESERSAVSINSRGYRLDRGGYTLLVDSHDASVYYAFRSFPLGAPTLVPLSQTPFRVDEAERLTGELRYWSQLVEQNRVWRQ